VIRLLRLGRVVRKLDSYVQYGAASLLMLICVFVLFAHWFACIWYTIGYYEIKGPIESRAEFGWLTYLDRISGRQCTTQSENQDFTPECRQSAYITALYFAMTSITSIGFGNVAANTDLEKLFATLMMLVGCKSTIIKFINFYLTYSLLKTKIFLINSFLLLKFTLL